jgi:hypothetical protein
MPHPSDATPLAGLSARWHERALVLEPYSPPAAESWRRAAHELDAALRRGDEEILTLTQSAARSGYSTDHLGRLIREGVLPNAGRPGAPRVRAGTLPIRPTPTRTGRPVGARYDVDADARCLLGRQGDR